MRTPFAESSSLFPVHTNYRIVYESKVREIALGHGLIIRIAEIEDPDQRIGIDRNIFLHHELRAGLARVLTTGGFFQIKCFRMINEFGGIDIFFTADTILGSEDHTVRS